MKASMGLRRTELAIFGLVVCLVAAICLPFSFSASAQDKSQGGIDDRVQERYAQAKRAQAAGNLTEAAARYEEIVKLSPRLAAAYNNLGSIYVQQKEFRKATQVLQKGLEI